MALPELLVCLVTEVKPEPLVTRVFLAQQEVQEIRDLEVRLEVQDQQDSKEEQAHKDR